MDLDSAEMPPIPARTHHRLHHHRRNLATSASSSSSLRRPSIPAASPEVISHLITSLSVIAQPASSHFDSHPTASTLSVPASPSPKPGGSPIAAATSPRRSSGSFGVDYGAYNQPEPDDQRAGSISIDYLAASPPVIRTAKPPSGLSPLTAPHSPRSIRSASRESGLRSFIRSSTTTSRPSSKGSLASRNDDAHSIIGNPSIEPGPALTPEPKPRRSLDSWGKKTGRANKGLMYMGSKERLREKDTDKKRVPSGTMAASSTDGASSTHSVGQADSVIAEAAISEEYIAVSEILIDADGPRHIPTRDSSLRKTGSSRKTPSARRPKRNSEGSIGDAIIEADEPVRTRDPAKRKGHRRSDSDALKTFLYDVDEYSSASKPRPSEEFRVEATVEPFEDEGAPFPSVSQGRRRDELAERSNSRLSGRVSPGPNEVIRPKRSSSRLKRLSGPLSPSLPDNKRNSEEPKTPTAIPAGYERPKSADSIDDAVESYLCSPRLSQQIRHPQTGRVISFSEVGDAEGSAVFCCVGMGLTRYITAFYDELALTLKLRLITPDRPGVGGSEPYADGTTPLSWPDDVYAICQCLKITKFSILAHSAGAIYALATALRMPQHIRGRIHLLAPWIPPSQMNVFGTSQVSPPSNTLPTSQRILRALPTPILKAANSSFMSATSTSITSSLPKNPRRVKRKPTAQANAAGSRNMTPSLDKENLNHGMNGKDVNGVSNGEGIMGSPNATENMDRMHPPRGPVGGESTGLCSVIDPLEDKERQQTYDTRLTHAIWELATTGANPAVDLLVCLERRHTIGFRYVDITRPVIIHHGSRDTRVPVENVKWLGKTMRRCEVRVLEGEGHGLMASAAVMGSVLMEISKEWDDWMRVTGADGRKDRERGRRGTIGR